MATVSTAAAFKRALLDEIAALNVASATAAAPVYVQVEYAKPVVDKMRSECVYFADAMTTIADAEQRMVSGRRRRHQTWDIELVVSSQIIADAENAELRAFEIAAAIESFMADNPQPAEWVTAPTDTGVLSALIVGMAVDQTETADGYRGVEIVLSIEMQERLT